MKHDISTWNYHLDSSDIGSIQFSVLLAALGIAIIGGILAIETLLAQLAYTFEMIEMFNYGEYNQLFLNGFFWIPRWILTGVVVLIGGYILGMELWVIFNARSHTEFLRAVSFETVIFVTINGFLLAHNGPRTLLFVLGVPLVFLMIITVYYGVIISPVLLRFIMVLLGLGTGIVVSLVVVGVGINNALITISVFLATTLGVSSLLFQRSMRTERVIGSGITYGSVWLIGSMLLYGIFSGGPPIIVGVLSLVPLGAIVLLVRFYPGITTITFSVFSGSWVLTGFMFLGSQRVLVSVLRSSWEALLLAVELLLRQGILAVPQAITPVVRAFTVSPVGFSVVFCVFAASGFVVQYTRYVDSSWVFMVGYTLQEKFVVFRTAADSKLVNIISTRLRKSERTGWDSLRYRPGDEPQPYQNA